MTGHPARWWHALDDGRLQCDLCPRECRLRDGQRGFCFVRQREGDGMVLDTYGRSSGFCVDPVEKKPLWHFLPGSSALSFGTAGCNLGCKFCQNWDISKSREIDTLADQASPEAIADAAVRMGAESVAFTYNDPIIFAEYAIDVADACRERGVRTIAVSAGYISEAARAEFFAPMDAANIDLKAFTPEFYRQVTGAQLAVVQDTLRYLVRETSVWTEITTLLIPTKNDSDAELRAMSEWIVEELGVDVPHHFSALHPDFKMRDLPRTPPETLARARRIAMEAGERYVYTGNVHDREGGTTLCPGCGAALIVRDWQRIVEWRMAPGGRCSACGRAIPGVWTDDGRPGGFDGRRLPVRIASRRSA